MRQPAMPKIILKVLIVLVSILSITACTATDELPGYMPGSSEKRVKKSPDTGPAISGYQLAA
jgi:hypothetical protein